MKKALVLALLLGLFAQGQAVQGEALWKRLCAQCHGGRAQGARPYPGLEAADYRAGVRAGRQPELQRCKPTIRRKAHEATYPGTLGKAASAALEPRSARGLACIILVAQAAHGSPDVPGGSLGLLKGVTPPETDAQGRLGQLPRHALRPQHVGRLTGG